MWFDGMGYLSALDYLEIARENIEEAIRSCERDIDHEEIVARLNEALALL